MVIISDEKYADATHAFILMMNKYIVPLLPVKIRTFELESSIKRQYAESQYNRLINYDKESGILTVVPKKKNPAFILEFCLPKGKNYTFRATEAMLAEMIAVTPSMGLYSDEDTETAEGQLVSRLFDDPSEIYFDAIINIAFEKGLSVWLGGTGACGLAIFRILHKLETWTRKTYEGRHVSFGVIIDKELETGSMDYIGFLDNRNSALVSDGVFSAVYLDRNGKLIKSVSTAFGNDFNGDDADDVLAPYEYINFANICRDNRIGIIAIASGDILIIKDSKLIFCKRNDEWSLFDSEEIIGEIASFLSSENSKADRTKMWEYGVLAREIYKTVIDVSFAYTGGCIGVCTNVLDAYKLIDNNTVRYDEYISGKYDVSPATLGDNADMQRKRAIAGFIWYDGKARRFDETNRKLRMECASFDGAVMIDTNGEYVTVGSIVKVSPGGVGGRTLAARSLAGIGMGIKISSDGGIIAYRGENADVVFAID